MIKVDNKAIMIEGSNLEVASNFLHIVDAMTEHRPEMVAAYIKVRSEELDKAISRANIDEIRMAEAVFKGISTIERRLIDEE